MAIAFKTAHGTYLTAEQNTGRVAGDRTAVGRWEAFELERISDTHAALKTSFGTYLTAEDGGGRELACNRTAIGPWETFGYWIRPDGSVALQAATQQWVRVGSSEEGYPVTATKDGEPEAYEVFTVEQAADLPDVPPTGPATLLRIESNRRWFANDRGRVDYKEVSLFSLLGVTIHEGIAAAVHQIDLWQSLGFNAGRVAATFTLYPGGQVDPERTPGYWEAVHALTLAALERGFYLRWTLIMASEPWGGVWHPDRRDIWKGDVRAGGERFCIRFVDETKIYPNVLYEMANEPGEIGLRDSFDWIVSFGRRLKGQAPDHLFNGGSPHHEGDQALAVSPFDFSDCHLPRHVDLVDDHGHRTNFQTIKRSTDHPLIDPAHQQHDMPFLNGEIENQDDPRSPDWDARRQDYSNNLAAAFCMGAVSRVAACYWNFHFNNGIYGRLPNARTQALARAFVAGLNSLPMPDRYELWRGHHAQSFLRQAPFAPDDAPNVVRDHVRRGHLWRVVGTGNYAVGICEHPNFDASQYSSRPLSVIGEMHDGGFACRVYQAS